MARKVHASGENDNNKAHKEYVKHMFPDKKSRKPVNFTIKRLQPLGRVKIGVNELYDGLSN